MSKSAIADFFCLFSVYFNHCQVCHFYKFKAERKVTCSAVGNYSCSCRFITDFHFVRVFIQELAYKPCKVSYIAVYLEIGVKCCVPVALSTIYIFCIFIDIDFCCLSVECDFHSHSPFNSHSHHNNQALQIPFHQVPVLLPNLLVLPNHLPQVLPTFHTATPYALYTPL